MTSDTVQMDLSMSQAGGQLLVFCDRESCCHARGGRCTLAAAPAASSQTDGCRSFRSVESSGDCRCLNPCRTVLRFGVMA